jgi:hypothetical protein
MKKVEEKLKFLRKLSPLPHFIPVLLEVKECQRLA